MKEIKLNIMKIKSDKKNIKNAGNNSGLRIAIIISKFNETITSNLLEGAMLSLKKQNVEEQNVKVFSVPGAFEIPIVMKNFGYVLHSDHSIPDQVEYETYRHFVNRALELGTYNGAASKKRLCKRES